MAVVPAHHDYAGAARRLVAGLVTLSVLAVSMVAAIPAGVFDPVACAAAIYVLFIVSGQAFLCDFTEATRVHRALIFSAVGSFLCPTALHAAGLWTPAARPVSWVFSISVMYATFRYMVSGAPYQPPRGSLKGRVCIITGCNTGLGYWTAESLAKAGARVVFACRSEGKAKAAMQRLLKRTQSWGVTKDQLVFLPLDTASLRSVRAFAERFAALDLDLHVLCLNAGAILTRRGISEDGLDLSFATNYFGHFLLLQLLLPRLLATEKKGGQPRIVNVMSAVSYLQRELDFGHLVLSRTNEEISRHAVKPFDTFSHYGQSKLAGLLFQNEMNRHLRRLGSKIPMYSVNPGECLTEIQRNMPCLAFFFVPLNHVAQFFVKSAFNGARGLIYGCAEPGLGKGLGDEIWYMTRRAQTAGAVWKDEAVATKLWELSMNLTGAPVQ